MVKCPCDISGTGAISKHVWGHSSMMSWGHIYLLYNTCYEMESTPGMPCSHSIMMSWGHISLLYHINIIIPNFSQLAAPFPLHPASPFVSQLPIAHPSTCPSHTRLPTLCHSCVIPLFPNPPFKISPLLPSQSLTVTHVSHSISQNPLPFLSTFPILSPPLTPCPSISIMTLLSVAYWDICNIPTKSATSLFQFPHIFSTPKQ